MYKRLNSFNNISYSKLHTCRVVLNKYTDTIFLPKTKFPQKLVGKKVSEQIKNVSETRGFNELYSWQNANLNNPEFILHDGPPYANGLPHMGHAINKILKDVINRCHILRERKVNYIPGWDCHGLPIELKALSKAKKLSNSLEIRSISKKFAKDTIEKQRSVFKSWGVIADWENSYLTYSIPYIKNQLKQFYELYRRKLIYRDVKPVYWSPSSRTALAEAELEYNTKHKSTATIVRFKLDKLPKTLQTFVDAKLPIYALIWTTTPWTLPSNQAICYNSDLSYSFIKSTNDNCIYLIATNLIQNISSILKKDFQIIASFKGKYLEGLTYIYPFKNDTSLPFLAGQHATASKGTGLVHTAPAHGPDDFLVALNNKLPIKCVVDEEGYYTEEADTFKGLSVLKDGDAAVIKYLNDDVLNIEDYVHSYPYDWRTKKPVIIRASQQWFIDTNSIKDRAIELLEDVKIYPEKNSSIYKSNFISQLRKRPYWCISRQRVWGVPIPVFYNKKTKSPIITEFLINHLCEVLEKYGTDYWWTVPIEQLFPKSVLQELNLSLNDIEIGQDILDIWFDSGISWSSVLGNDKIADLYLEGMDQFTGWFQSSLLTSVAIRDKAPFKSIYVHGFAVDENGYKMSKSIGNVIDPQDIINGGKKQSALGIDTLRWWVTCHASQDSTAFISSNVLQASADEVQKIRNTLRFALGTLSDYNCHLDNVSFQVIDKYLLHLLYKFNIQINQMYDQFQFNHLGMTVINFITNPVSALYYTIIKDRLYCNSIDDEIRRSSQFVLYEILTIVCKAIAPIMPHLVEELYMHRNFKENETFFKSLPKDLPENYNQPEICRIMETVLNIRRNLNKQYSDASQLEVNLNVSQDIFEDFQIYQHSELVDILQVSQIILKQCSELTKGSYTIVANKTNRTLCPRCRKFVSNNDELCVRCMNVIKLKNKVAASG